MQTNVTKKSAVEFELEVTVSAEDLKPEVDKVLRAQRAQTQAKGFRPGKVPLSLVKKLYGPALAAGVAERKVQEVYNESILDNDEYDVVGQPVLAELDYEIDSDLRALVRFGTRPQIELADLSDVKVPRLKFEVEDELVEEQLEDLRRNNADLSPSEEAAGETDQVVFDIQELDLETDTAVVGRREEDRQVFLDDPNLTEHWKTALLGKKAGETFRVNIPHGEGDHLHEHRYEITLKEVKNRELPELDDANVAEFTNDEFTSVDEYRESIRKQISAQMDEQSRELFESNIMQRMLELHDFEVPESSVILYLDSFVEDVKQRSQGGLPDDFNEEEFRESNRAEAVQQAKWMFIRDAVIEQEKIELTDEDMDEHFNSMAAGEEFSPDILRQYYEQMGLLERINQQLLSRKVFAALADKLQVEELDPEAYSERMDAKKADETEAE